MFNTPRGRPELLIFLHIPKASGSTLHRILEREYRGRRIWDATYPEDEDLEQFPPDERASIELVKGHLHFGLHKLFPQRATYVTLVREPVERVISHYYYASRHPEHYLHRQIVDAGLTLRDYVTGNLSDELSNGQVRILSERARELSTCDRGCLEEAKRNLVEHFPVVGVSERFDESVLLFQRAWGWRLPLYARANVGDSSGRRSVDDETRVVIGERNQLDRELYDFAVERFEATIVAAGDDFARTLRRFRLLNAPPAAVGRVTRRLRQRLHARSASPG